MTCCGGESALRPVTAAATSAAAAAPVSVIPWERLLLGLFLAGNSMVLTLALNLSEPTVEERRWLQGVLLALTSLVVGLVGGGLGRAAWLSLRQRRLSLEFLFIMGIGGASGASMISIYTGRGPVYLEVVSILLVIYSLASALKSHRQQQVRAQLRAALPAAAPVLRRAADGSWAWVDAETLRPGDRLRLEPGRQVPADGLIATGRAFVQQAALTGEGLCVSLGPGEPIWAGSHLVDASLEVEVGAAGAACQLAQIEAAMHRALAERSQLEQVVDRLARRFVPCVAAVAGLTLLYWWPRVGGELAFRHSMATLLVACPCALGFATPLGMWTGMIRLARLQLRVRSSAALENLARIDRLLLDKTGTLTAVSLAADDLWCQSEAGGPSRAALLPLLQAAQAGSDHPIARAFVALGADADGWRAESTQVLGGIGLAVTLVRGAQRHQLRLGEPARLWAPGPAPAALAILSRNLRPGMRPIAIELDGILVALAGLADRPLGAYVPVVAELARRGIQSEVLSGDGAVRVAQLTGLTGRGDLSAADKLAHVQALRRAGHVVAFVGDGINDAAAMAASDVSIAVAAGAPLATDSADIVWQGGELATLAEAHLIAVATLRLVRHNLIFALGYNVVGLMVAAAGALHPVFAALLMLASSSWVTVRSAWALGTAAEPASGAPPALGLVGAQVAGRM